MDYGYVLVTRLMLEQATLIFEMELVFNLITILLGTPNFEQVVISQKFCFLELYVLFLHFRAYKYFYFRLTGKPYPKFCQISTMGCVIKTSVAHALRRG